MNKVKFFRDFLITSGSVLLLFFLLSIALAGRIPLSSQNGEVIALLPTEAYLRGSLKIEEESLMKWKGERNLAHWRFKCTEAGLYKITVLHGRSKKGLELAIHVDGLCLNKEMKSGEDSSAMGELHLFKGNHNLVLQALIGRKDKLPPVKSILITKIKEEIK
jgi:hypothetical protein